MNPYLIDMKDTDQSMLLLVGGKGAHLGELEKIEGIQVPQGFCITTAVFKKLVSESSHIKNLLDCLAVLQAEDREQIKTLSAAIRQETAAILIPGDIREMISNKLSLFGDSEAYAIRSSATAEDLPTASFAGQQDTYLNITGIDEILKHISKCWASLFTDRAIIYRLQNGIDHREVYLSVIVQKMVLPEVAGILFTADPVTSNRKTVSIDASFGLGEALVSGLVNADNYTVSNGCITGKRISTKKIAIYAAKGGGTISRTVEAEQQKKQALTDDQILQLANTGRKAEAHFGRPQDIEWCLARDTFYLVQSRPITTLYPIPEAHDNKNHVYISVGHQQMMTDAMKPLGLSLWQHTSKRPMPHAGGRIFVDVTQQLASQAGRDYMINVLGKSDPLIRDALMTIIERGDFVPLLTEPEKPTGKCDS